MIRRFFFTVTALSLVSPAFAQAPPKFRIPGDELKLTMSAQELPQGVDAYDWSVKALKADIAHKNGITGKGVIVTVCDTGVSQHEDLKPIDTTKDNTGSSSGARDAQGHGTHCSGSIACRINGVGLIGVAPNCTLRHEKVLGDNGSGGVDDIAAGVRRATDDGADVLSLSLGGDGADSFIPPAFAYAESKGVIILVAAGNDGRTNGVSYPGRYKNCICVAAVDANLKRASFSNGGPEVFVSGPGVNVRSTYLNGQYAVMSGTSMATPNIAGVAALWIESNPSVPKVDRPAAFRKWLAETCTDLGTTGRDNLTGYGFPDCSVLKPATPTDPTLPVEPVKITLGLDDLTVAARLKLSEAGISDFALSLTPKTPLPTPMPKLLPVAPTKAKVAVNAAGVPIQAAPAGKRWTKPGALADPGDWTLEDAPCQDVKCGSAPRLFMPPLIPR